MGIAKLFFFIMVPLILLPVSCRPDTMTQQVVAKVMRAYGGQDTIQKIHAVCAKGRIVAFAFNAEGTYSYCVAKERKLRVDIDYTNFAEHRMLNGQRAYVQQGDGALKILAEGADFLSVVYQYEQLSLPRTLLDQAGSVHYEGNELDGDRAMDILSLETAGSPSIKLYVDEASGRIVKTSSSFRMEVSEIVLSSAFFDFRKVGSTIFPFKFINYAGGDKIAETSIQGYEMNPPLADDTFLIPEATTE